MHKTTVKKSTRTLAQNRSKPKPEESHHRCRLFEVTLSPKYQSEKKYTEVWDTLENPIPEAKLPSSGKILAEEEDTCSNELTVRMEAIRKRLSIPFAGFWNGHTVVG